MHSKYTVIICFNCIKTIASTAHTLNAPRMQLESRERANLNRGQKMNEKYGRDMGEEGAKKSGRQKKHFVSKIARAIPSFPFKKPTNKMDSKLPHQFSNEPI